MQPPRRQPLPKPAFGSSPNLQVRTAAAQQLPTALWRMISIAEDGTWYQQ
jgi:hypothetical protein